MKQEPVPVFHASLTEDFQMIHVTNQSNSAKFRQNGARAAVFPQHPTAFGVAQNEGPDARNSRSDDLRHTETANLPAERSQHYLPMSGAPLSETRGQDPVSPAS